GGGGVGGKGRCPFGRADVGRRQAAGGDGEIRPRRPELTLWPAEMLRRADGTPRRQELPEPFRLNQLGLAGKAQRRQHAAALHFVAALAVANDPAATSSSRRLSAHWDPPWLGAATASARRTTLRRRALLGNSCKNCSEPSCH